MGWLLEQWHDIKGHAKWWVIGLTGGAILWLMRGLLWWQKAGWVGATVAFGLIMYVIGRSERKTDSQQNSIDARPINRSEVYEIGFRYLPSSPLANGWEVVYQDADARPAFTSPEAPGVGGLTMDVKKRYAIHYNDLPQRAQSVDEIELAIKYGEDAMFHIIVNVTSRDGSQRDFGHIKILLGNAPPRQHKDYPKEYLVYVTPERLSNGWVRMQLRLPEIVTAAMGIQGWVYDSVQTIQLRGCISVSPIKFFGKGD